MNKPPAQPKYSPAQAELVKSGNIKEIMTQRVIDVLFEEAIQSLQDDLESIIQDNTALVGSTHASFIYKGKYYNQELDVATSFHDLHESLYVRMDDYLAEMKQIFDYEVPIIRGTLKSLFIASDRISDYKQVLPEQVHKAFDDFFDTGSPRRFMMPTEIIRMKQRITPFLTVMKARMLNNRLTGRGQP